MDPSGAKGDGLIVVLLLCATATTPAGAQDELDWPTEQHDTLQRVVEMFEPPERREWQKPERVLELLGLEPGQRVADLGAGTGYFIPLLSEAVGESGRVFAVDTSQTMLDYIRQRGDVPHDNVETVLADPADPKLPAGAIDVVLVVNTWQYIDGRIIYLDKLAAEFEQAGWMLVEENSELPYQYFLIFTRPTAGVK